MQVVSIIADAEKEINNHVLHLAVMWEPKHKKIKLLPTFVEDKNGFKILIYHNLISDVLVDENFSNDALVGLVLNKDSNMFTLKDYIVDKDKRFPCPAWKEIVRISPLLSRLTCVHQLLREDYLNN